MLDKFIKNPAPFFAVGVLIAMVLLLVGIK